ncbi:MAG: PSD1 and planctomycete cytochrome C domain-containing protein [Verrucomicrobiales bacterium]|nr:PSD1 and planctomycete cytochrome C domain-containing protein [Verrucomicrobiales bacterium]
MRAWVLSSLMCGVWAWATGTNLAADFSKQQLEFFEHTIRPLLVERCYECHTGHGAKSGLKLDSRAGVLRGTDYRKVVVPGQPEKSALLFAVKHVAKMGAAKVESMPRKGDRLSAQAVADLTQWVKMGVPWPEEESSEEDPSLHWAFQPVVRRSLPSLPLLKGASRGENGIDAFVEARLQQAGMSLAGEADRRTLIRRLSMDLIGLPPTFEQVQAFVEDESPRAYQDLVDRLLQSPQYGERWGRHWLDVARYSDTKGYRGGGVERRFIYSYTYRDWVIRALNEDLPYDQFLLYQLAADYLTKESQDKKDLAAMGFLTLGRRSTADDDIDDRLDVTFRGTMALTVSCARCHDHKFDPIPTEDYYSLANVFFNSEEPREAPVIGAPEDSAAYREYLVKLAEKQKAVDDFLNPKLDKLAKKFPNIANRRFQLRAKLERVEKRELRKLQGVLDKFVADSGMEADRALILQDKAKLRPGRILIRGSRSRPGKLVKRHFLQVVAGENPPEFKRGSGRLEMAQAIVDVNNPLTARTMANRVWQHHFGQGLVRTPSDFGLQGEKPTHPELLDWLAVKFIEGGWSLKNLHRLILNSATYKQGSVNERGAEYVARDPENRLLWRMNRLRLEFEPMRDAALMAAGRLDEGMFGRSVKLTARPFTQRRAVYAYIDRQNLDPVFGTFDFASPQKHTAQRPYTTIPTQTLFMLNSPFVMEQAEHVVKSVGLSSLKDEGAAVNLMYRKVLAREPSAQEMRQALAFLANQRGLASARDNQQTSTAWQYGEGHYDEGKKQVFFSSLSNWDAKSKRWQPTAVMPDREKGMGYLHVYKGGGHPSNDPKHGVVVRWQAASAMRVAVSGHLQRRSEKGDGVRLRVVHSRLGLIREQLILGEEKKGFVADGVEMKKGDFLDLVVDCREGSNSDSFTWDFDVQGSRKWSFADGFGGPGRIVTPLENLAQALLCTNEFMFVD